MIWHNRHWNLRFLPKVTDKKDVLYFSTSLSHTSLYLNKSAFRCFHFICSSSSILLFSNYFLIVDYHFPFLRCGNTSLLLHTVSKYHDAVHSFHHTIIIFSSSKLLGFANTGDKTSIYLLVAILRSNSSDSASNVTISWFVWRIWPFTIHDFSRSPSLSHRYFISFLLYHILILFNDRLMPTIPQMLTVPQGTGRIFFRFSFRKSHFGEGPLHLVFRSPLHPCPTFSAP